MANPFFSVVIPTKNRVEPLKITIESILGQEYADFECIIVDNNDDDRLAGLCEGYRDNRLRRVRTGGLHMADNYDAALQAARGQYVTLNSDKQCLYGHALLIAYKIIQKTGTDAFHWGPDVVDDREPSSITVGLPWGARKLHMILSDDVLAEFTFQKQYLRTMKQRAKQKPYLRKPRIGGFPKSFIVGSFAVVKRSLLNETRASTGHKICLPVDPGVTMGCHLLNRLESYYFFDGSLSFFHSIKTSTGGNMHVNKKDVNNYWHEVGGEEIGFRYTPIKCIFIENLPYNDYLAMTKLLGGRLASHSINWAMYYVAMYEENARNHRNGFDRSRELKAWKDALDAESWGLRLQVKLHLFRLSLRRALKRMRSKSGLRRLERILKGKRVESRSEANRKVQDVRSFLRQETARLRKIDLRSSDSTGTEEHLSCLEHG